VTVNETEGFFVDGRHQSETSSFSLQKNKVCFHQGDQNVAQAIFCRTLHNLNRRKRSPKMWATFYLQKAYRSKKIRQWAKIQPSGRVAR
jgi:hypothetical protein